MPRFQANKSFTPTASPLIASLAVALVAVGCHTPGLFHSTVGELKPAPLPKIAQELKTACEAEDAQACDHLGLMYQRGDGVDEDIQLASRYFLTACKHRDLSKCGKIDAIYFSFGLPSCNTPRPVASSDAKDPTSPSALTLWKLRRYKCAGVDPDHENADLAMDMLDACVSGDGHACAVFGAMHTAGDAVAAHDGRAVVLSLIACESFDLMGCNNLAYMFQNGRAVPKNLLKAARLYHQACEGNYAQACSNLAHMYSAGMGVTKDLKEAHSLYHKACNRNYPVACYHLARQARTGVGRSIGYQRALELYEQVCDSGFMPACFELGLMHEQALGVRGNEKQAAKLYRQACDGGHEKACERVNP